MSCYYVISYHLNVTHYLLDVNNTEVSLCAFAVVHFKHHRERLLDGDHFVSDLQSGCRWPVSPISHEEPTYPR